MPQQSLSRSVGGVENEIDFLRRLIDEVARELTHNLDLDQKLAMLETVGHAAPQLARMLKVQRELAGSDLDPAALLREALLELQEEWSEFSAFCKEFQAKPEEPLESQT